MVEVQKTKHEHGYDFRIRTEEGTFGIFFAGNLDLYWYCDAKVLKDDKKSFTITKENYFLYALFEELFNRVKNCDFHTELDVDKHSSLSKSQMKRDECNPEKLFQYGKIDWHSDDAPYDIASRFTIEEGRDTYLLTFYKSKLIDDDYPSLLTFSVRLRNSGSSYRYFNIPFMLMYNKFTEYEPDYHQMHIEEYLYQKRLKKVKEAKGDN